MSLLLGVFCYLFFAERPLYFQAENTTSRDEVSLRYKISLLFCGFAQWMATIRNISAFCGVEVSVIVNCMDCHHSRMNTGTSS